MANLKHYIALLALSVTLSAVIAAPYMEAVAFANYSNTISATLTISGTCTVILSNTAINFGTVQISGNAPTANDVADTNNGNNNANILIDGTNWVYASNSFFAANTIWDFTSHSGGVAGNTLGLATGNIVDTFQVLAPAAKTDLFFGTQIPAQQAAGAYTQTITIENFC